MRVPAKAREEVVEDSEQEQTNEWVVYVERHDNDPEDPGVVVRLRAGDSLPVEEVVDPGPRGEADGAGHDEGEDLHKRGRGGLSDEPSNEVPLHDLKGLLGRFHEGESGEDVDDDAELGQHLEARLKAPREDAKEDFERANEEDERGQNVVPP